jgi:hypothetical protein
VNAKGKDGMTASHLGGRNNRLNIMRCMNELSGCGREFSSMLWCASDRSCLL